MEAQNKSPLLVQSTIGNPKNSDVFSDYANVATEEPQRVPLKFAATRFNKSLASPLSHFIEESPASTRSPSSDFTESRLDSPPAVIEIADHVPSETIDIAIIGADIAGIASALAIHKRSERIIHIFEAETSDVVEACVATSVGPDEDAFILPRCADALEMIDSTVGTTLFRDDSTLNSKKEKRGAETRADFGAKRISRSNLRHLLWRRCQQYPKGIFFHFNSQILGIRKAHEAEGRKCSQRKDIELTFSGEKTVIASVVISGEGSSSEIRQILNCDNFDANGKNGRLQFHGLASFNTGSLSENSPYIGFNTSKGAFCTIVAMNHELVHWAVIVPPTIDATQFLAEVDEKMLEKSVKGFLLSLLDDSEKQFPSQQIQDLISATPARDIQLSKVNKDTLSPKDWTFLDDRVILIGDVIHPKDVAFSRSLDHNIEDGLQLAYCIADWESNDDDAIQNFKAIRKQFLAPVVKFNEMLQRRIWNPSYLSDNVQPLSFGKEERICDNFLPTRNTMWQTSEEELLQNAELEAEYL